MLRPEIGDDETMIPIHELLQRIRWDAHYDGEFIIGYYDRVCACVVRVPFTAIAFPPDDHFAFIVVDADGTAHSVPYHRVREVIRNGELIWRRSP